MQKRRLHEAMFLVAFLWPWVGKKDKHRGETHVSGKHIEKQLRFGPNEMQVAGLSAVSLANCSLDSLAGNIDPHANGQRMRLSVAR